ncbi:unnamed protein product, partial [Prorocentrum cordatum]
GSSVPTLGLGLRARSARAPARRGGGPPRHGRLPARAASRPGRGHARRHRGEAPRHAVHRGPAEEPDACCQARAGTPEAARDQLEPSGRALQVPITQTAASPRGRRRQLVVPCGGAARPAGRRTVRAEGPGRRGRRRGASGAPSRARGAPLAGGRRRRRPPTPRCLAPRAGQRPAVEGRGLGWPVGGKDGSGARMGQGWGALTPSRPLIADGGPMAPAC